MSHWEVVEHKNKSLFTLLVRKGVRRTSYRFRYRREDLSMDQTLHGDFERIADASKAAFDIIKNALSKGKVRPSMVRTEVLCKELVTLRESKSPATFEQTKIFFEKHIIPWVNENAPYASELNPTHWQLYKNFKRLENPEVTLFNHWKFWVMLLKYAFEKGLIKVRFKLEYNEEKEDFREQGRLISDQEFQRMIEVAPPIWRDRLLIQRYTGMRPGETRRLKKDRFDPKTLTISLQKQDTKTRRARSFEVASEEVVEILQRRLAKIQSPYFFPSESDKEQPMGGSLKGWHSLLKRAKVCLDYTPHDLRHTYLTEMFKTSENPALICFQAGLSLEEAQDTYLHFTAADTRSLANKAAEKAKTMRTAS